MKNSLSSSKSGLTFPNKSKLSSLLSISRRNQVKTPKPSGSSTSNIVIFGDNSSVIQINNFNLNRLSAHKHTKTLESQGLSGKSTGNLSVSHEKPTNIKKKDVLSARNPGNFQERLFIHKTSLPSLEGLGEKFAINLKALLKIKEDSKFLKKQGKFFAKSGYSKDFHGENQANDKNFNENNTRIAEERKVNSKEKTDNSENNRDISEKKTEKVKNLKENTSETMQTLVTRTKNLLVAYKEKEKQWKQEKKMLINEISRLKSLKNM